jgi:CDP-paratose synthetase
MQKLLITGSTGYLGSHLLKRVVNSYEVAITFRNKSSFIRINREVSRIQTFNLDKLKPCEIIKNFKPEIIIHSATNYGRHQENSSDIVGANLILPLQLLDSGLQENLKCFINTDTFLDKRINDYSLSKKQFSEWLKHYSASTECKSINMILEHFYGSFDDDSKFLTYVFRSLMKQVPRLDFSPGEQKRDFIFIDDVMSAFEVVLNQYKNLNSQYHEFYVGTGTQTKIKDLVFLLKRATDNFKTQLNFGVHPYRVHEKMEANLDISPLLKLGWKPKFSLEQGIGRLLKEES